MIAAARAAFDPDVEEVLLRVYHLDPHSITLRRLWVIIQRLPLGSWKKDQGAASWDEGNYLLAQAVDAINQVAWTVAQVNSKKQIPQPKPIRRPGETEKRTSWANVASELEAIEGVVTE